MRNLILVIIVMLSFTLSSNAQFASANVNDSSTLSESETSSDFEMTKEMERSTFIKIQKEVVRKIQQEIVYPELAYENEIEGKVLVAIVFDGHISKMEVVESLGAGCDEAALKAMQNFPKYYKELGGKNIRPLKVIVPFTFGITL